MRKYKSCSTISLNVFMPRSKTNRHVSFVTNMGLGSSLYVEDEELQEALEKHPAYGRLFYLESDTAQEAAPEAEKAPAEEERPRVFKVFSLNEAKDLLNREFGVLRSNMKTMAAVLAVAKERNVVLEGLE